MNELIAIVEDEEDIIELVSTHLKKANFNVEAFLKAGDFLNSLKHKIPDLLLLDLMLPDMDGMEVCKHIRQTEEYSNIPIIMLTAKGEESDKIIGLELGADDYVTKPFSPKELTARVKAVLRRRGRGQKSKIININNLITIDLQKFEVYVKDELIKLTPTEFRILKILAERKGWVFSREQLLDYLWGHDKAVLDRTIDVHIKHLREKLGECGFLIKNIRGIGYKLDI